MRFIELIDTGGSGNWDSHGDMMEHDRLAKNVNKPISGLLRDAAGLGHRLVGSSVKRRVVQGWPRRWAGGADDGGHFVRDDERVSLNGDFERRRPFAA